MDAPRRRRFDLVDLLIAVTTVSVALALVPSDRFTRLWTDWADWTAGRPDPNLALGGDRGPRFRTLTLLLLTSESSTWLRYGAALVYLACRLRSPRPPAGELRTQPGFVAGAIALSMGLCQVALLAIRWDPNGGRLAPDEWLVNLGNPAAAVIGGWLGLRLAGRWRPDPGWIDRLGRILGWTWIATFLFEQVGWALNLR